MKPAKATAHSNIALCKYWGKRTGVAAELNLPATSSLSMTLDGLWTETELSAAPSDRFELDGAVHQDEAARKVWAHLDRLWRADGRTGIRPTVSVRLTNHLPTAAGLASSASGFAALTLAAAAAFDVQLDRAALSALARMGSGSAARSLWGGFVRLDRGHRPDGSDCMARPVLGAGHWDVRLLVIQTTAGKKPIGSTAGMERSRTTSPYYGAWIDGSEADLERAQAALVARDLVALGSVVEHSALKMHACMIASVPSILYWNGTTVEVMRAVWQARAEQLPGYVTIDAGPHVKVLCEAATAPALTQRLGELPGVVSIRCCAPGPDAEVEVLVVSTPVSVPVSAPGKAFLIGEYAVLDGAPALVTAVDVRAVAHAPSADRPAASSAVVHCAQARVAAFLEGRGETVAGAPAIETGGFTLGQRKLGLGSSAAVAAAVVGHHLAGSGLDPTDPDVRQHALAIAQAAHAEAQGGTGSGADVATAVLGGTIRFVERRAEPVVLAPWLAIGFVDAGAPAVTSSFVQAVKAASLRTPAAHRDAVAMLRDASAQFGEAAAQQDRSGFVALRRAVELHVRGLRALQACAEVPILTPEIDAILELCGKAGVAAKPSGAGGGDLVVLFAADRGAIDRLAESLRQAGWPLLGELRAASDGLRAEARVPTVSRLSGFFKLSVAERRRAVAHATGLPLARLDELADAGLDEHHANHMIENVVGTFDLPLAVATNFRINGRDVLVPMCVEEASVVAAASNAAKMIREGGGFAAHSDPPWMIAQVQLCRPPGARHEVMPVLAIVREHEGELLTVADAEHPRLVGRGGGARAIEARALADDMACVHVLIDCQDAMGANLINAVAEAVAERLAVLTGWEPGLRILSNLADRRRAHVSARVPPESLATKGFAGTEVAVRIASASRFAELDPYRAATHNKGIMNGVDAVVLATGNDWRAMEASAHAYAALPGRYGPLATWKVGAGGWLEGTLSLPAAVGVVGGATQVHPVAKLALEILGNPSAAFLGQVMAAAGLASNLAALRAMATEGIQRGHMSLHARSVALSAGAIGPEVELLAARLIEVGEIKLDRATQLLVQLRNDSGALR